MLLIEYRSLKQNRKCRFFFDYFPLNGELGLVEKQVDDYSWVVSSDKKGKGEDLNISTWFNQTLLSIGLDMLATPIT